MTDAVTIICRLTLSPDDIAALDRMARQGSKSRDLLIRDYAKILVECETPPRRVA